MTTAQLTSEIYNEIALLGEDESKLERLLRYVKRLATPKPDPTRMTREEFEARVLEAAKGSGVEMYPNEDLTSFLKRMGYAV